MAHRAIQVMWVAFKYLVLVPLGPRRRRLPGPVRLRLAVEELGATWIKLGQALALRFDLLPPAYCYELFKLLNEVKPFPYEDVRRIIREELGDEPQCIYGTFAHEPFAAASIGQVHRATLKSGVQVAVKVQRPGIERLIAADLSLMYFMSWFLDAAHVMGGTRSRHVIDEFARWTSDELDYTIEARNAYTIRRNAAGDRLEYDPKVYFKFTTEKVLTLEYLDGIPVIDIMYQLRDDRNRCIRRLRSDGYDLGRVASNIIWNSLNQVYAIGFFHADLHPANLLVRPGNQIGYVDFGITGRLPSDVRESLVFYAKSLFAGDVDRAVEEFSRWISPSSATNPESAREDLTRLMEQFLFDISVKDRGGGDPAADFQVKMLESIRRNRMTVLPAMVAYMKAIITMDSIVYDLDPDFDLRKHQNHFFGGMLLESTYDLTRPSVIPGLMFEYRYRLGRALDTIDTILPAERDLEQQAQNVRSQIEVLGLLAGIAALLLYATSVSHKLDHYRIFGIPLTVVVAVLLILLLVAMVYKGRQLPRRGRPRRIRRRRRRITRRGARTRSRSR